MDSAVDFHELYTASYGRLVVQVYAFCGDLTDAEDAVQEAFVGCHAEAAAGTVRPRGES